MSRGTRGGTASKKQVKSNCIGGKDAITGGTSRECDGIETCGD